MILTPHRCIATGRTARLPNIELRKPPSPEIATRPATPADAEFLYRVYAGTRLEEVAAFGWPDEMQDAFLRMQYRARSQSYAANYPDAEPIIVLDREIPVGSLRISRAGGAIRLVDIAFLPECRNRGRGTEILTRLAVESETTGHPLRLSVATDNPSALRLYERFGFVRVGGDAMYLEMERPCR